MAEPVRVGLVDSGCEAGRHLAAARAFHRQGDAVVLGEAQPDRLGHGSAVSRAIRQLAPDVELYLAQVFAERLATSAAQVAAALDWLSGQGVELVNLSLGLRHDRPALRAACARAADRGIIVCASAPARGAPVYPAFYPRVLRMTGDARCRADQFSWLATRFADCGGCPSLPGSRVSGASMGCAHLSGHIARFLAEGGAAPAVRDWLRDRAAFIGPENRRA